MANLLFKSAAFFILVIVLVSCNSIMKTMTTEKVKKLGIYDRSVPEDSLTTLLIPAYYTVNDFDGKKVKWKGLSMVTGTSMIKIPSGSHAIAYKYSYRSGGASAPQQEIRNNQRVTVTYYSPYVKKEFDKELSMEFAAGKTYIIDNEEIRIFTNTGRFSNLK